MTRLVRGGVILSLMTLFVVFMYAQGRTEETLSMTTVPAGTTVDNSIDTKVKDSDLTVDDKKLIKKTVSEKKAATGRGSFTATAYCLKGRTALGHGVRRGLIAADPRVLRLGSRINLSAGSYSGEYLVSDTGGAVRGRRIDIWMPSCSEARRFGRRTVLIN